MFSLLNLKSWKCHSAVAVSTFYPFRFRFYPFLNTRKKIPVAFLISLFHLQNNQKLIRKICWNEYCRPIH